MSRPLKRVFRVRALREEMCRLEFEAEAGRQRTLERNAVAAREEARESRRGSFASMAEAGDSEWLIEEAGWELASSHERRLRDLIPAQQQRVERSLEAFLASRREKLEVETLIEAEEERLKMEWARREQSAFDEWFRRAHAGSDLR